MRITYYLFKKAVKSFDEVWKDGKTSPKAGYVQLRLRDVPYEAEAYLQANKASSPDWWKFAKPYCDTVAGSEPLNQSNSFVLLLKAKGRVFAVTFGHGFTAINRDKLEADFGLKVTLNSVDPSKLRSLQARNIDPTTVQKQLVVSQDSALSVFDVDFFQDLLAKIEGVPEESSFGSRVAGAEACYLLSDVEFPKLAVKCEDLLARYGKKRYQENFRFVDQVRPVRDEALIADLDAKLTEVMKAGDTSALGFALPDIGAYDQVHKYRLHSGRWNATFDDLSPAAMLTTFNAEHPGSSDHLSLSVRALKDDDHPIDEFTLRQCAVFQVTHKQKTYVLTLSQWYQVNESYAAKVDAQIAGLSVIAKRSFLPSIHAGESEGDYNIRASMVSKYCLMDKKNVKPSGASSAVEVCDMFSKDGEFIHVKRHTRSATLSHLLAQGSVSAKLFVDDQGYRKTFRQSIPASMRALVNLTKVEFGKFSVVYAISAPPGRSLPQKLPFFTKVNLLFHSQTVSRMGLTPKVFHIQEA